MPVKKTVRKSKVNNENQENLIDGNRKAQEGLACINKNPNGSFIPAAPANIVMKEEEHVVETVQGDKELIDKPQPLVNVANILSKSPNNISKGNSDIDLAMGADENQFENCFTNVQNGCGKKRLFQESSARNNEQDDSVGSYDENETELVLLKKQCIRLEAKIHKMEVEWMPKPQQHETIQYFIDTANLLRDRQSINICNQNMHYVQILTTLGMDQQELQRIRKNTATATARSLIRYKYPYPRPNFGITNVDKSLIDAIIDYTKYSNPCDTSSQTTIRKAIGNYFSSITYKKKLHGINSQEESEEQE